MLIPQKLTTIHQDTILPLGNPLDRPWLHDPDAYKRHYLSFPQFPFRTLHPRNINTYFPNDQSFNGVSPIFPANTQMNIVFKRRKLDTLINFLLPTNLNYDFGSQKSTLEELERQTALSYTVKTQPAAVAAVGEANIAAAAAAAAAAPPINVEWEVVNVEINIKDIYMQVGFFFINESVQDVHDMQFLLSLQIMRLRFKGIHPERPLSLIYNYSRTQFTPVQKVSLFSYGIDWDRTQRPESLIMGFVK